jgi:glycolate oxidase iron-sulfur subunit
MKPDAASSRHAGQAASQPATATIPVVSATTSPEKDRYAIALDCVHCGLCLPVCPTYTHLGDEADSPRGRIYLMRAHSEGRQQVSEPFLSHLDRCLVCRACETACPSGVQFGRMMEDFRDLVRPEVRKLVDAPGVATARRLRFRLGELAMLHVLPHRRRLGLLVDGLRIYQRSGLAPVVRRSGLLRLLGLEAQEAIAPPVPARALRRDWPEVLPPHGPRRARVLFLRGCVTPEFLPEMQRASLAALRHNGCEVVTPPGQTCCGALHFHTGERARGMQLLRQNVRAFDLRDVDAVIVNAAGCGSTMKEYHHLAAGDGELAPGAAALAERVRDIHEFLDALGLVPPRVEVRGKVAYDEPCHLLHAQRLSDPPKRILRAIPGLQHVPLVDADRCCGSAGVYNVAHPELAGPILDEKIGHIAASGATLVATGNSGCILQLRAGIRRAAPTDARLAGVLVVHPMQLLAASYGEPWPPE